MSYQAKKSIADIITSILILGAYCIYAYGKYQSGALDSTDLKSWAGVMLIFIGIGIGAAIVIQIIFHILLSISIAAKEAVYNGGDSKKIDKAIKNTFIEDEMDKLIGLKASRVGPYFTGAGFIAALGSLVLGFPTALMLNILFVSWYLGSAIEGFTRLIYYRKGIKHG